MLFGKALALMALASLCFVPVWGQRTRIIDNSGQLLNGERDTLLIKRIRRSFWSDSIVVRLENKQKLLLAPENIWGYQSEDKTIYRYYHGEFLKVRQIDTLIVYSRSRPGYKTSHTDYYLSKTLDSEVFGLSMKNLEKHFGDNPCFLDKINNELKWYQEYASFDKSKGTFKIVEFYKSCGGLH